MPGDSPEAERYVGESYSEFLLAIKALSGFSNKELAQVIGLSHGSISNYLRGERVANAQRIAIANAFGLTNDESTRLGGGEPIGYIMTPEEVFTRHEENHRVLFRKQLAGALIERVASGGPIGEVEDRLIRDLAGLAINNSADSTSTD